MRWTIDMQIGFIGFGEAAYEITKGLKDAGINKVIAYDVMQNNKMLGQKIKNRTEEVNVDLLDSTAEVLEKANIVIVAVPANKTFEVYESTKNLLQKDTIYVDLTASNPEVKNKIGIGLKKYDVRFIDAAIMGPVTVYKHRVPILVSGEGTEILRNYFKQFGMNISDVSKNPGDASAIKLIRSIYMKGISALLIEMLEAARKFEVEELVIDSISETLDSKTFEETMNRLVTGTAIHADRRSKELEGVIGMLESYNLNSTMSEAVKTKLETVSNKNIKEKFQGEKPNSWIEVIDSLK